MLVASDGLVGERIVGIVVSCNSDSKSYGEATDEKYFLSIAGGYKYSYSSMLVLFYALGMIIEFFCLGLL